MDEPPAVAKAFWEVARGPVGKAAGKGLRAAAKVTLEVGKGVATAGAPAAKWAAKEVSAAASDPFAVCFPAEQTIYLCLPGSCDTSPFTIFENRFLSLIVYPPSRVRSCWLRVSHSIRFHFEFVLSSANWQS